MQTQARKAHHIKICLDEDVQAGTAGFEDAHFLHKSLPELSLGDVDVSVKWLGRKFDAPIIISGMTGGTEEAGRINRNLAEAAARANIPMGVGSQRAAIENPAIQGTFSVCRDASSQLFLIANLGAVQLNKGYTAEHAKKAIGMISANALALHLNPLQEACQAEGDTDWGSLLPKIRDVCRELSIPVIAKETGAGICAENARELERAGVKAIDVSGSGGTSWSLVESYRGPPIGRTFADWGIPTAVAVVEASRAVRVPVIASGGIRTGIDAAKCIALGASMVSVAHPFLVAASESAEAVYQKIESFKRELTTALFLTGAQDLRDLRRKPLIITGKTREWLELRGIDVRPMARR
jgi:isopentenyl-diphosphate delta-isomerase